MSTFTIASDNNITAHAGLPAGADNSQSFATAKELAKLTAEWPVSRLLDTWNSFAGVAPFDDLKPTKKFTSRKAAVSRIWLAIQRLSPNAAPQATPVAAERTSPRNASAKASKAPKFARAQKNSRAKKAGASTKSGNKKAEVIAMMKRAKGATLAEIMKATGWQKHTVRGFVSILGSKGGEKVESSKSAAGERCYRVK